MKRTVLRFVTLATLFALILPTGGVAVGQSTVNPGSTAGTSGSSRVYLPVIG